MAPFLSFCTTCFVYFLHINDFIAFLHCTVSSICLTNLCLNRLWNLNHKTKWGRRLSYGFTADMFLFWMRHHCNCTSRTHRGTDHTMECFTMFSQYSIDLYIPFESILLKMGPPLLQSRNSTRTNTVIPKHKNNLFTYIFISFFFFFWFRNNIYTDSFCDCAKFLNT